MEESIKSLRIQIDGLHQLTKELKPHWGKGVKFQIELGIPGFNSKEIEESAKSLLLAKAWLGKLLGELDPAHIVGKNFSSFTVNMMDLSTIKGEYADAEIIPGFNYLYKSRVVFLEETSEDSTGNVWGTVRLATADPNDHIEISNNPYSSGKKEVKDIEPTADVADQYFVVDQIKAGYWVVQNGKELSNHIEKVDWLRSEIQKVIDQVNDIKFTSNIEDLMVTFAWKHLCEAKMWLGFEFGRIRDEN